MNRNQARLSAFVTGSIDNARKRNDPKLIRIAQRRLEEQRQVFTLPAELPPHLIGVTRDDLNQARDRLAEALAVFGQDQRAVA